MTKKKKKKSIIKSSPKSSKFKISEKKLLILILLLALSIRFIYLLQIKDNPFFYYPDGDSLSFDTQAKEIANGNWDGGENVWFQGPLYPYFLAIIYALFGHHLIIVYILQIILGVLNCFIIYLITKKLFNIKSGLIAVL